GRELELRPDREPDERRQRGVGALLAEQRRLQVGVGALERVVVPVEAAARLRRGDEQAEQDRAEERLLVRGLRPGVGAREDARRRLPRQLLEREQRVVAAAQPLRARLDEAAHEGAVFVQRGAVPLRVLLEREGQLLAALLQVAEQVGERAEHEGAEREVEVRR